MKNKNLLKSSGSYIFCIIVLFIVLSFTACAESTTPTPAPAPTPTPTPTPAPPAVEPILLKFAMDFSPQSPTAAAFTWWGDQVAERSGGKVKFEYYPGGVLFKAFETLDAVPGRIADISNFVPSVMQARFPLTAGMLSFLDPGFPVTVEGGVAAGKACMTLYEEFPEVRAEWEGWCKFIFMDYNVTLSTLLSNKEIRVPSDIAGLKFGGTLGRKEEIVKHYGGASVHVIPPEIYMSMDRGVIDVAFANWSIVKDHKLWEVAKYSLVGNFGSFGDVVVMNVEAWNELPPDVQKLMIDVSEEMLPMLTELFLANAKEGQDAFVAAGGTIVTPTTEEWDQWQKDLDELVFPDWLNAAVEISGLSQERAEVIFNRWKQLQTEAWK